MGKSKKKVPFKQLLSKTPAINALSAARFFLFGARDVWFVVGLPLFLESVLGWSFTGVGTFFAVWIIGYGFVQGAAPRFLRRPDGSVPNSRDARFWVLVLVIMTALLSALIQFGWRVETILIGGLLIFGAIFAINSAVHSFLILAYTDSDKVALNVGFYYMANAGGRLTGTIASGILYQVYGMSGTLWGSVVFLLLAWLASFRLPHAVATEPGPSTT